MTTVGKDNVGKGKLLWFGVPLELTADGRELTELYRTVLEDNGVKPELILSGEHTEPLFVSAVRWGKGVLYTLINESSDEKEVVLEDCTIQKKYRLTVPGNESFLFITDEKGKVLSVYKDRTIKIP